MAFGLGLGIWGWIGVRVEVRVETGVGQSWNAFLNLEKLRVLSIKRIRVVLTLGGKHKAEFKIVSVLSVYQKKKCYQQK